MKIKDGFVLKNVAGKHIVVPIGDTAVNFSGLLTLNESGVILFECLTQDLSEDEMVHALLEKYEVSEDQARQDVHAFIQKLLNKGLIQ